MSAGLWNPKIELGSEWTKTIYVRDAEDVPISIQAPAYMDIRIAEESTSRLIARLDTTGDADGTIIVDSVAGTLDLYLDALITADLEAGRWAYDLFVDDPFGSRIRLLYGSILLIQNTSVSS